MNITQVYLTPAYENTDVNVRFSYQIQTNYIQLYIEECLRKYKVNLGAFNRLVFSEGGDTTSDFTIIGNNALPIAVNNTYSELETLNSDREIHNYFVRKFLEGFRKLDDHYSCAFVSYLEPLLITKYDDNLFYEKNMAGRRLEEFRLQIVGRYSRDTFKLIVSVFEKSGLVSSRAIYECEPDMFIVKYDVHKVEITDKTIFVTNKIREVTMELEIEEII